MPRQWTNVVDHDFADFANGAPGSGWTDVAGSKYTVTSGVLHGLTTGTSYLTNILLRPIGEAQRDTRVTYVRPAGADRDAFTGLVLRYQTDGDHYLAQLATDTNASPDGNLHLSLYTILDGTTAAGIHEYESAVPYDPAVRYRLEVEAVGGATVDFLVAVYDDETGVCLAAMPYRHTPAGATAALANAGRQGISSWNDVGSNPDATVAAVATYKSVPVYNVIGLGNSWLTTYPDFTGTDAFARMLDVLGPDYTGTNLSAPGLETRELIDMLPDVAALLDPGMVNVVLAQEYRNGRAGVHSGMVPSPLATQRALMVGLCQSARALGPANDCDVRVVLVDPLPNQGDEPSTWPADQQYLANQDAAHWREYADGHVPLASDTRIGQVNSPLDTTYFNDDKIHLNATGRQVQAEKMAAVVAVVAAGSTVDGTDAVVAQIKAQLDAGVDAATFNGGSSWDDVTGSLYKLSGTLGNQAGMTSTTVKLAGGAVVAGAYVGDTFATDFQSATITAYNSSTRVATVEPAFTTQPLEGQAFRVRHGSYAPGLTALAKTHAATATQTGLTAQGLTGAVVTQLATDAGSAATNALTAASQSTTVANRVTSQRATNLDNLNATVSSRATPSDVEADTFQITPFLASTSNPRFSTKDLPPIPQHSAPADAWTITDATGEAVDLSGKSLRFVVYSVTDAGDEADATDDTTSGSEGWKYETGGQGITLSGADNNVVTVQHDSANNDVPGQYRYALWNVTDELLLAKGKMNVIPCEIDV